MMHFTPKKAFGALAALLIFSVLITTVSCAAMFGKQAATGIAVILPTEKGPRFTRENAEGFAKYFNITLYTVKDGKKEVEPLVMEQVAESTVISTLPGTYFVEVEAFAESNDIIVGRGSSASNGAFWEEEGYEDGIFELKAAENVKPVVINMNVTPDDKETVFTLIFNPDGGLIHFEKTDSSVHTETAIYSKLGEVVLYPDVDKPHYSFGGWMLNGKVVEQGEVSTSLLYKNSNDGAISFVAKWNPIMHTVTYMDADDNSVLKREQFEEANGIELYKPTKPYFTFDRWYKDPELESFYISELTTEDVVLYAAWNKNIHNINFDPNGGTISPKPDSYFYEIDGYPKLPVPTMDGYKFAGWYKDKSFAEKSKVTEIAVGTSSDVTLYAKWEPKTHTLTCKHPDGTDIKEVTFTEVDGFDLYAKENDPEKEYFNFGGWYSDPACTDEKRFSGIPAGTTENVVVYALWEPIQHSISFVPNGGKFETEAADYFFEYEGLAVLPVPTQEGAEFGGWYRDKSCAADSQVTSIAVGTNSNLTLYAKWVSIIETGIGAEIDADIPSNAEYYIETTSYSEYAVFKRLSPTSSSSSLSYPCVWYKNGQEVISASTTLISVKDLFKDTDVGVFTIACVFTPTGETIEYSASLTVTRE